MEFSLDFDIEFVSVVDKKFAYIASVNYLVNNNNPYCWYKADIVFFYIQYLVDLQL